MAERNKNKEKDNITKVLNNIRATMGYYNGTLTSEAKEKLVRTILKFLSNEPESYTRSVELIKSKPTEEDLVTIEKYDIVRIMIGPMEHYAVIYKRNATLAYVLVLTTDERFQGIELVGTRMLKGYVIPVFQRIPLENILKICGIFENKKYFNEIVREVKKTIKTELSIS